MELALHGACLSRSNLATQAEAVGSAGFDGLEIQLALLERYLQAGHGPERLLALLSPARVTMVGVLLGVEREPLTTQCKRAVSLAADLACDTLQVVALDGFDNQDRTGRIIQLRDSVARLAEVAQSQGVRLALEPVCFSGFSRLDDAMEVVSSVGSERVGLVLDTWHLWAGGASWDEVRSIPANAIACVHISDSGPRRGAAWSDADRTALPGDGVVPLVPAVDAVRATGFDGVFTVELHSAYHAELSPRLLAGELFERARTLLARPSMMPAGVRGPDG